MEKGEGKRASAYLSLDARISPEAYSSGKFPFDFSKQVIVQFGFWVGEAVLTAWGKLHGEKILWICASKL